MTPKKIEQTASTMTVLVGKLAPDFTLTAHTGEQVTLSDFWQHKNVILYFYICP
jgi:Peroxiredoxin